MSCCRKWRQHLVESVYGELTGERRAEFEAHVESCPRCADELAGLSATAAAVAEALPPRPQPGEVDVWSRIQGELDALDRPPVVRRLELGFPAAAALAAALLAIGVGLGLMLQPDVEVVPEPTVDVAAEPAVDVEFARYLERSTPLLLAIANRRAGVSSASFDPVTERRVAERLAAEATQLASDLEDRGDGRRATLVGDLGVVFLQIANLPERNYGRGIEMVQATIETRALLFQLSVEEMRLGDPEA